jgi:hypothetical protein
VEQNQSSSGKVAFQPLGPATRQALGEALRSNVEGKRVILMDRRDTSFAGTADEITDEEVISAICSVPCHYLSGG